MFSFLLKPEGKSICSHFSLKKKKNCLSTSLGPSLTACLLCPEPINLAVSQLPSLAILGGFRGHSYLPSQLLSSCVLHIWTSSH